MDFTRLETLLWARDDVDTTAHEILRLLRLGGTDAADLAIKEGFIVLREGYATLSLPYKKFWVRLTTTLHNLPEYIKLMREYNQRMNKATAKRREAAAQYQLEKVRNKSINKLSRNRNEDSLYCASIGKRHSGFEKMPQVFGSRSEIYHINVKVALRTEC